MLPRLWLLVGSDRPRDRQTMSVIELSWTAKKGMNLFQEMFKLSWQLHRSKRWKLLACQLSTVLYKNVLKEAGGKMYLSLLFHPFIPRIERVATAATSVGVVPPGVEIAGAPSVVSRVSPLLLCSYTSAPPGPLTISPLQPPVVTTSSREWRYCSQKSEKCLFYLQFLDTSYTWKYSWIVSENKCFSKMYKQFRFWYSQYHEKKSRMLLKEMKHLSDFNL